MRYPRSLLILAPLAGLPACGPDPDANPVRAAFAQRPASRLTATPVVFRFPGDPGGTVRVYRLPRLDEVTFRFDTPGLTAERILGYSDDDDQIYLLNPGNTLLGLDLATGRSRMVDSGVVAVAAGPTGSPYVVHADGSVAAVEHRVPVAWSASLPPPVSPLVGAGRGLLLAEVRAGTARELFAMTAGRPTIRQPLPHGPTATSLWGDIVAVGADSGLVIIDPLKASAPRTVPLPAPPRTVAISPSGHRLYAGFGSELVVVDRFAGSVLATSALPGEASELRVDPWGRILLVRPSRGDSLWIVDLATNRYLATVPSSWGADLPAVSPDGTLLTRQGADLVALAADSLTPIARVRGKPTDRWLPINWDPLRPIADLADQSAAPQPAGGELLFVQVSFSLNETWAQDNARNLRRAGLDATVLPPSGPDDGYRVVLGPYPSREAAETAGRKMGVPFFVFSRTQAPPAQ